MALSSSSRQNTCSFTNRGGVIVYYARHRAGMGTLCFAVKIFCISINNLYLFFYEPRPLSAGCLAAKTRRGEGGLLCVRNCLF